MSDNTGNNEEKPSRRQQILEALARELETRAGNRITTAGLARAVGVSEAALYRHFASKAQMFEALIEFCEHTVFGLINRILADEQDMFRRCEKILHVVLGFAEKNPGISRILTGDALVGEHERLHSRIDKFYQRLETQLKQVLREGRLHQQVSADEQVNASAGFMLAYVTGCVVGFVRSEFRDGPLRHWESQRLMIAASLRLPI